MAAITADQLEQQPPLRFAESQSKAVGLGGRFMEFFKNNAASIVGALYIAGGAVMIWKHPDMMIKAAGVFIVLGRSLMMAFGSKKYQQKLLEKGGAEEHKVEGHGIIPGLSRAMRPKAYPVETAAASSIASNILYTGYGAKIEIAKRLKDNAEETAEQADLPEGLEEVVEGAAEKAADDPSGITAMIVGSIALLASANMLFGRERDSQEDEHGESLTFEQSTSKAKAWMDKKLRAMSEKPVLTSSLIFAALTVFMVAGSIRDKQPVLATVGALALVANIIQAIFVRKKEFSIEGAEEKAGGQEKSFAEREIERRTNEEIQPGPLT